MLLNMMQGGSTSFNGFSDSETASIAYDGTLLPVGTASYGSELYQVGFPTIDASKNNATNYYTDLGNDTFRLLQADASIIPAIGITDLEIPLVVGKYYNINMTLSSVVSAVKSDAFGGISFKDGDNLLLCTGTLFNVYRQNTPADVTFKINSVKEVLINPNTRYLKNSGKDKTPALVESGQGKFFNGTSQYINTGSTPTDTEGTFITRFTYASGAIQKIMAGMNYSNNRCYMGINASGKIGVGFGANTYDTMFSPDVLVAGRSYHVSFRYSGSTYWLFVDNVLKATGTITGLSSFVGTSFFIGALNNGGTASNYFNSVIDETYYYDVALPDTAIQSLYLYPEKVKSYNGAIVPDIGYEANCKLFLPLCENSGSNVVNVAVARGNELVVNGGFDSSSGWSIYDAITISGGTANFASTTNALLQRTTPLTVVAGKAYEITLTITSYTSGTPKVAIGNVVAELVGSVGEKKVIIVASNTSNFIIYAGLFGVGGTWACDNVSVKEITAYPIASYTTAMHTSAAKLPYGAQCTAWKRDSLGVLLGMSNGLSFDGGVSVKQVATTWIPLSTENFVAEAIVYSKSGLATNQNMGAKTFRWNTNTVGTGFGVYTGAWNTTLSLVANTWNHLVVERVGTSIKRYKNGVLIETLNSITWTSDITAYTIGDDGFNGAPFRTIIGTPKIHKGTQYAKFNIAKAWAKAQKTIARLGA